jgi:hypothetical protein
MVKAPTAGPSPATTKMLNRWPPPAGYPHDQGDQEDYQEHKEEYLRDTRSSRRRAAKAEEGGDDCDDEKYQRPVKIPAPSRACRPPLRGPPERRAASPSITGRFARWFQKDTEQRQAVGY